jgi:serine/threonine-protein kinase
MRICPECEKATDAVVCPACGIATMDDAEFRAREDPLIGRALAGRYRVEKVLGRGGMGKVFVAEQVAMKRRVALKVIHAQDPADASERTTLVKRFQREALAVSRLEHPHTVRVFDFGRTDDDTLFMVMELLKGRTLGEVIRAEGRLDPRRAVAIAIQVCKSLAEAHAGGVVHRDLKPENIMLVDAAGERDYVKVLDFGIAKIAVGGTDESNITRTGMIMGTPAYMAPEQATAGVVGPATDLYSLGVVLYEALSGRTPFNDPSPLAILMKHAYAETPPLVRDGSPPDVPPALVDIVSRLLEKDPARRPASAMNLADSLDRIVYPAPGTSAARADPTIVSAQETILGMPRPPAVRTEGAGLSRPIRSAADGDAAPITPQVNRDEDPAILSAPAGPVADAARVSPVRAAVARTVLASGTRPARSLLRWWPVAVAVALAAAAIGLALAVQDTPDAAPGAASAPAPEPPAPAPPAPAPAPGRPDPVTAPDTPPAVAASAKAEATTKPGPAPVPARQKARQESKPRREAERAPAPAPEEPVLPACVRSRCPFEGDCADRAGRRIDGRAFCGDIAI